MSLIAVPGLESGSAGVITYWRLKGPVNHSTFVRDWVSALGAKEDAPEAISVDAAVNRAVKSMRKSGRLISKSADTWVIAVDGVTRDEEIVHSITCRVDSNGGSWINVRPYDHPWAPELRAIYARFLDELQTTDFSSWLVGRAEKCDAVSLRDTGGFYFIPPADVWSWRHLVNFVNNHTQHRIYEIPAVSSEQAVSAVVDAISEETRMFAQNLEEELSKGNLGERALESWKFRAEQTLAKVGRYEVLLGAKLDELRSRVEAVNAELVAGILSAQSDEEGGSNVLA